MSKRKPEHHVKHAGTTNSDPGSLIKVVVRRDAGDWVRPDSGDRFYIDEHAIMPSVAFEIRTDVPPPYTWRWYIKWDAHVSGLRDRRGRKLRTFSDSGRFSGESRSWTACLNGKCLGGELTVYVDVGGDSFKRTVVVLGKNPDERDVTGFLATIPNSTGFDRIIRRESRFKNFIDADGQPVVAGDGGYGMTQLTTPVPDYEQCWSWKENIRGGVQLYQQKQLAARHYLGQCGRRYTSDQLANETLSRWNGGGYHTWNEQAQSWERNPAMVCDPATGNIGWDTSYPVNSEATADQLHERDKGTYTQMKAGQSAEHKWKYSGVCYADHIASP